MAPVRPSAWQYAVRLLTAGDRSLREVRQHLRDRDYDPEEMRDTLERLQRAGYVDDARVAVTVATVAARRGYGSIRARLQMQKRGIDAEHAGAAIEEAFRDEAELARQVFRKRFRTPPGTPAERGKAARYLAQRGFPSPIVLAIVGEDC